MAETRKPIQPERLLRIQELLENRHTVKVVELSDELEVSENTIRRDLMKLEEAGLCFRTKGGAGLLQAGISGAVFSRRIGKNRGAKQAIAQEALNLVESGSSLILDSGTTAFELALALREKEHVTIITPSIEAMQALTGIPELTIILSGGIVHASSRSLVGPQAESFFETIHADILFLTVKAISLESGLTDHSVTEASVKRKMIQSAARTVVLADHSKLGQIALSKVADLDVVHTLITDSGADPSVIEALRERGVEVVEAPVEAEEENGGFE